jgi:hypothetical protein
MNVHNLLPDQQLIVAEIITDTASEEQQQQYQELLQNSAVNSEELAAYVVLQQELLRQIGKQQVWRTFDSLTRNISVEVARAGERKHIFKRGVVRRPLIYVGSAMVSACLAVYFWTSGNNSPHREAGTSAHIHVESPRQEQRLAALDNQASLVERHATRAKAASLQTSETSSDVQEIAVLVEQVFVDELTNIVNSDGHFTEEDFTLIMESFYGDVL